ncbi:hypothetical protein B6I39_23585 [Klebsiella quasipneumoniae]|nr:hypothetical protein B6I39_23585 [Klebsiella quasipneumoniae]
MRNGGIFWGSRLPPLGGFGVHKFYLGKIGQGFLYLIFCWTFIPAIIAFIEFIIYLCDSDEKFARKYG